MALAQYVDEPNKVRISRRMGAPKKVTSISHWYKQAKEVINHPHIPCWEDVHYEITYDISSQFIKFTITSDEGVRTYLVIDRTAPSLGAS